MGIMEQTKEIPSIVKKFVRRRASLGVFITIIWLIGCVRIHTLPFILMGGIMSFALIYWSVQTISGMRKKGLWYVDGTVTIIGKRQSKRSAPQEFYMVTRENQEIMVTVARGKFLLEKGDLVRAYGVGEDSLRNNGKRYRELDPVRYEIIG